MGAAGPFARLSVGQDQGGEVVEVVVPHGVVALVVRGHQHQDALHVPVGRQAQPVLTQADDPQGPLVFVLGLQFSPLLLREALQVHTGIGLGELLPEAGQGV